MRPILVTPILVLLVALASPATALHCNGTIITIETPAATLYVDDRSDAVGQLNHWVYLESNGQAGLQSGLDTICPEANPLCLPFSGDPCRHADPDTLLL